MDLVVVTFLSGESVLARQIYPAGLTPKKADAERAQRCRMLGQQVYIWDMKAPQLAPTARQSTSVRSHSELISECSDLGYLCITYSKSRMFHKDVVSSNRSSSTVMHITTFYFYRDTRALIYIVLCFMVLARFALSQIFRKISFFLFYCLQVSYGVCVEQLCCLISIKSWLLMKQGISCLY